MGNNGRGKDYLLLKKMIRDWKYLTINENDSYLTKIIKEKMNNVLIRNRKTTDWYKIYISVKNANDVINKLRQQNWFWEEINLKYDKSNK